MRVFITGATGWIGSAIVRELVEGGHRVTGLVRSERNSAVLSAMGATPVMGSLDDLDLLREGSAEADGVIHTAFGIDFSKFAEMSEQERRVIELFGDVYQGSDRPIVATAGFLLLPPAGRSPKRRSPHRLTLTFRARRNSRSWRS